MGLLISRAVLCDESVQVLSGRQLRADISRSL
jgi:hypothetical protein